MPSSKHPGRILIVDDLQERAGLLTAYLVSAGHEVLAVPAASAAGHELARDPADLILVDDRLGGDEAFDLCRRLKQASPSRPVIMITTPDSVDGRVNGLEAGADDLIARPIQRVDLLLRVESQLQIRVLRKQLQQARAELESAREALRSADTPVA